MIKNYKDKGKEFFVHGNKGKKPVHALSDEVKKDIVDLYNTKYYDANFTHYSELLYKHNSIKVSPKANRSTKRKLKKLLNEEAKKSKSKKEIAKIQELIVSTEDAHPRRPRSAHFGEMIQMDASSHNWFLNEKVYLHVAVDDCTGSIVGACFDREETLYGYYNVLYQILIDYGIPYMFYTDRKTVFEYKQKSPLYYLYLIIR